MKDNKKHIAILAKNQILRMLKSEGIQNLDTYIECLKDIEKVIGEGNQPSIDDISKNDSI